MSQLLNLPLNDSNKFIVVDEGNEATYAEYLLLAWLQNLRKEGIEKPINILLFCYPKYRLEKYLESSGLNNVEIQDYFSISLQSDQVDVYEQLTNFTLQSNSILVVDCLSTLALQIGMVKAIRFVEKLSQNHKSNVFCIYRRDVSEHIPRIETLGNIYVQLKKSNKVLFKSNVYYVASVIHKKSGGSIAHWNELVKQNVKTYYLESEKIAQNVNIKTEVKKLPESNVKPQASFRIEMNENEMKQRDSVPLPYILPGNPGGGPKIIYVPDDLDDLDEEDPDDDLDI